MSWFSRQQCQQVTVFNLSGLHRHLFYSLKGTEPKPGFSVLNSVPRNRESRAWRVPECLEPSRGPAREGDMENPLHGEKSPGSLPTPLSECGTGRKLLQLERSKAESPRGEGTEQDTQHWPSVRVGGRGCQWRSLHPWSYIKEAPQFPSSPSN